MAKIYCPIENEYEIVGIYSSEEKAEEAAQQAIKEDDVLVNVKRPFIVWEYIVDEKA